MGDILVENTGNVSESENTFSADEQIIEQRCSQKRALTATANSQEEEQTSTTTQQPPPVKKQLIDIKNIGHFHRRRSLLRTPIKRRLRRNVFLSKVR
jgi:hypothetical protein